MSDQPLRPGEAGERGSDDLLPRIERGDIYFISVPKDQTVGQETQKKRPWVIVSANRFHQNRPLVIAVPLSLQVQKSDRRYWLLVPENQMLKVGDSEGVKGDRLAYADQVRVLSHRRIASKLMARMTAGHLAQLEVCLKYVMDMK